MLSKRCKPLFIAVLLLCVSAAGAAAGPVDKEGPIQSGYAVITPSDPADKLVVFETFGQLHATGTTQAAVIPAGLTTQALLFVSTSGRLSRYVGVAIANPNAGATKVRFTLRQGDGTALEPKKEIEIEGLHQVATFVNEIFDDVPGAPRDIDGTLIVVSETPIAVLGLRFRGENFSTLPVTNLAPAAAPVPEIKKGVGGAGAVILPQFAVGGGWASEIVLINTGEAEISVRVDLFKQDGTELVAELNGLSAASFTGLKIPAGGTVILTPRDKSGNGVF